MMMAMQLNSTSINGGASAAVVRRSGVHPPHALVRSSSSSGSSRGRRRHLAGQLLRCAADASDGGESDGGDAKKPEGNTQGGNSGEEGTLTLESEFMRVVRERQKGATRALATRWKRGGLRPRVVHESPAAWIPYTRPPLFSPTRAVFVDESVK